MGAIQNEEGLSPRREARGIRRARPADSPELRHLHAGGIVPMVCRLRRGGVTEISSGSCFIAMNPRGPVRVIFRGGYGAVAVARTLGRLGVPAYLLAQEGMT